MASVLGSDPEVCAQNLDRAKGEGKMEQQREVLWKMNNVVHEENGTLEYGVRKSDGDGTVSGPVLPWSRCLPPLKLT